MEPTSGLEPLTCRLRILGGERLYPNPICFQWCECTHVRLNAPQLASSGHLQDTGTDTSSQLTGIVFLHLQERVTLNLSEFRRSS